MRTQKRLSIALFVSVAVSLFLAGMLATLLVRGDGDGRHQRFSRFDREAAVATLSTDGQQIVREIWQKRAETIRDAAKTRRALRREMRELLLADAFDSTRYAALSEEFHRSSAVMYRSLRAAIGETAAALTSADRKKYFTSGFKKRHRKKKKD